MSFKTFLATTSLLAAASLSAATSSLYIPASGSGPGAAGSQWRSEVTFHNVSASPLLVTVVLYTSEGQTGISTVGLGGHDTVTASDLIKNQLERPESFGAIEVRADAAGMKKLAVTSRAINTSPLGEYGQDVPALRLDEAMTTGDTAVITGPYHSAEYRFNFGVFPIEATTIEWSLIRKNGSVAATKSLSYTSLKHVQYNGGVNSFFGVAPADDDVVHARLSSGRALFFGSVINNATGDPSYIPAVRVRENIAPLVAGIDLDENGTVDIRDADGDGRLDQALEVYTGSFPNFFRVIATDSDGSRPVTFTLVDAPSDAKLVDDQGTIQWVPPASLRGTTGTLHVRIYDGIDNTDLIIPVIFR